MIPFRTDEDYMRMALRQAEQAEAQDEVPIGAVAVCEEQVVGRAYNQVEMLSDATAHAEMIALTQAETAQNDWRLNNVTLYVTKEPCAMCAGAMVNARVGRLVYGCYDSAAGAAGSVLNIAEFPGMLHTIPVEGGMLEEECRWLLQSFFRRRRLESGEEKDNGRADQ